MLHCMKKTVFVLGLTETEHTKHGADSAHIDWTCTHASRNTAERGDIYKVDGETSLRHETRTNAPAGVDPGSTRPPEDPCF